MAITIACLINVALLVIAASTFYKGGFHHVESLEVAHKTLVPLLGGAASAIFALALLASGLASSAVGNLYGQRVIQGFMHRQIPISARRAIAIILALVVIGVGFSPTRALVLSQVFLSFGIPFALIPLLFFTRRRNVMGVLVNARATTAAAICVAVIIISLNVYLLLQTFGVL